MKKKVRIYKAPDGKGKFVNKTAKFLRKAQEGGQQDQQAQISDYVYKTLANTDELDIDMMKDSLIGELVAAKIPMDQAEQMVENIAANFESQEPVQEQEEETDTYDEGLAELERQEQEAEEERQAGLADDYGYYDDTAADGEDEEDEDDDDIPEEAYMQQGGDIIPEDNAVSFTGYDPYEYNQDKQNFYKQGGITKRKYIGQVMKLLKKQAGGEEEKPSAGFDPMDTMDNKKKNKKDEFVAALASSAQEAKMKEKAEAMWEQQQQAMMQQQVPMQPPMEQVPMAQRGMSVRQMRRMMPRGFGRNQMQSFAGMVPQGGFFPMGMNIMTYPQMQMPEQKPIHVQGTMPGMKLDVRKSHWLTGRPSQYSIEYGGDFAIPGFNMMPGKGYGTKSTNRKTIEGVSRIVNKAADPGKNNTTVLNNNPEYDKDGNGVPDNVQSNIIPSTPGTASAYDRNANNMLDVTEVKTNLPAVNNNPNKEAVGKGAKVPTKTETKKTTTATKSKQAGQSKPAASSAQTNKGKAAVTGRGLPPGVKPASTWKKPASAYVAPESNYTGMIPQWLIDSGNAPATAQPQAAASKASPAANVALRYGKPVIDRYLSEQQKKIDMLKNLGSSAKSTWDTYTKILGFESGGFVDSSNPDLYKFVYGGDDIITQQDMDYSDSRNTGSPFFANGGLVKYEKKGEVTEYDKDGNGIPDLIERTPGKNPEEKKEEGKKEEAKKPEFQAITSKEDYDKRLADEKKKWQDDYVKQNQSSNDGGGGYDPYGGYVRGGYRPNAFGRYFPANTVRRVGTWSQQQGMPYDPRTGGAFAGGFGPNTNLTKIDVRKSGWLSGRPKKYTMHFSNYNVDPKLAKFLEETSGAKPGSQPSSASSADYSDSASGATANKAAKDPKDFFGYSDAEWDKMSAKEKRQEKRNMKSQEWVDSLPDPEAETEETAYGPSAEEIAARDAATEANKGVIRNFSEVEGVQDDPFGIGMGGGNEEGPSDFEESTTTYDSPDSANNYVQGEWGDVMSDITEVLGEGADAEFNELLKQNPTKGQIDSKLEELIRQRNEVVGKDAAAVERDNLTADAEEEIMNQQSMQRNPMFMGSSGAPAANPNFGATPEIATGEDYQLSDREKAAMDYYEKNRRSEPVDFQPRSARLTESNIFSNRDQAIPNTRKPSEDLYKLAYTDNINAPTLPASQLEGANYEDMLLNSFPQYTDAFEGFASNDEQYLPGIMDGMSEGSVRNREIAAKQQYDQQQAAIRQQQQQASSGSGSQGSKQSRDAGALKEQAFNSDRQGNQAGNWTDDWDIKGVINKNKNQLETLKDSPAGQKTLYAIDTRWQNMSPAQRKNYGDFDNYLKVEGYDKFYNTMQGKIDQIAKPRSKKQKQDSAMEFVPDWMRGIIGKQYGGALSKFVYGDEVTRTSTGTESPVSNTNNPVNPFLRYDDAGKLVIPGFGEPKKDENQQLKSTLNYYEGYGEGDDFSAAPAGSTSTMDESGNEIVMSPDEARRRIEEDSFAIDFKNKDTYELDAQAMLNSGNALARGLFDRLEKRDQRRQNKDFYDKFTSDNLYASDPSRDRGDYDTNTGLYRPNEQGQIWNSRSKQLGGFMQEGGFAEGDVVDMTPEELEEFLANGGEVEIIS
jgi:hypothetical protein